MASVGNRGAALFNEKDYNHATDDTYKNYRQQASELYDKKNKLSQQSQEAFQKGDKQKAHELSEQLKKILDEAENYNRKAAEYVFLENNADSKEDEIDLHGLYVKEAKWILQKRISESIRTNQPHLKVIVGKGLHSENGVAKLKPAIDEMCDESNLKHHMDPKNAGVLVIDLNNTSGDNIPSHWDSTPLGQGQGQGPSQGHQNQYQPQPQQQPQYQQQPQQGEFKTGNLVVDMLLKIVCNCLK